MDNNNQKEFNNLLNLFDNLDETVKNSPIGKCISSGIDLIKLLDEYADEESTESKSESTSRTIEIEDANNSVKDTEQHIMPSAKLHDINKKLEIHKIVQAYVDEEIKPFVGDIMTQQQIMDAYSALYEFACWVLNK